MVVWNSMLLKIIIISSGVAKQHVRFIFCIFAMRITNPHGIAATSCRSFSFQNDQNGKDSVFGELDLHVLLRLQHAGLPGFLRYR